MIVELFKESVLVPLIDLLWIIQQRVGNIVGSHAVQQELIVSQVGILFLVLLEAGANEVPEAIGDQRIEMLHLYDVLELLLLLVFAIAECHTRQDVFL